MPLTVTLHCHLFISTTEQNQWLRENFFDVHGNYLYCLACIVSNLGVHTERLSRQRKIKVNQCQAPVITLAKREVIEKKLQSFVLYPRVNDICGGISDWWDTLLNDDTVEVEYPHERHGLAGRMSNHSKPQVQEAFLQFVDANSHPNGRQAGSYSPQFFFIPKFTIIDPPKLDERDFQVKAQASVVWVFNQTPEEAGKMTCSAFAVRKWLKTFRPKVALHPHESDNCDTCKLIKEETSRQAAILKRLMQVGSAEEQKIREVEANIEVSEERLCSHKEDASAVRDYYNQTIRICT